MIRVRVELMSAITGCTTELARIDIANDGVRSCENPRWGNYICRSYRGRDEATLDKGTVSKTGEVLNYPRKQLHVWNLVSRALSSMGYA